MVVLKFIMKLLGLQMQGYKGVSMYKILDSKTILNVENNTLFPIVDGNRQYEEYKVWLKTNKPNFDSDTLISIAKEGAPKDHQYLYDLIINPEKIDEVPVEYLTVQTVPAVEEVQAQSEYWSNGEETVYDADDIPTVEDEEGNAILDPSYVRTPAVEYVAPQPEQYRLVKKNGTDAALAAAQVEQAVRAAITFGNELIVQFSTENIMLGITADGMTKTVRQNMSEITNALIIGSLYDAIDEVDNIPESAKDGKYITDERLQKYKAKIQEYLGE